MCTPKITAVTDLLVATVASSLRDLLLERGICDRCDVSDDGLSRWEMEMIC